jgi:DNA polymerase-3 subunit delta'
MRAAVMARAERLTEQAADALLKTLEEPPPGTLIVLCTANPEALPATIRSRAQQVALSAVAAPQIVAWLEGAGVESRLAGLAAALSGGRPGRAHRLATEPGLLAAEIGALHAFLAVAGGGMDGALRAAAELTPGGGAEGRERAMLLLAVWSSFVRDAALEATAVTELRLWTDYGDSLGRWAESLGPERLTDILGLLLRASGEIAQYAQPRLTFETLFLDIFVGPQSPPPVDVPALPTALTGAPAATRSAAPAAKRAPGRPARRR